MEALAKSADADADADADLYIDPILILEEELQTLHEENVELRNEIERLLKFTHHISWCKKLALTTASGTHSEMGPCNCGLEGESTD